MANVEDVQKLAALARLSLSDEELTKFAGEFDAIIGYIGQLNDVVVPEGGPILPYVNVFRADGEPDPLRKYTEKIAEQFPAREGDYLSVKQILSHD
jgi:aspartyl-tRNA(Asn)/glutamyl-tRNA(Gln) amidotransferase subunit C